MVQLVAAGYTGDFAAALKRQQIEQLAFVGLVVSTGSIDSMVIADPPPQLRVFFGRSSAVCGGAGAAVVGDVLTVSFESSAPGVRNARVTALLRP